MSGEGGRARGRERREREREGEREGGEGEGEEESHENKKPCAHHNKDNLIIMFSCRQCFTFTVRFSV